MSMLVLLEDWLAENTLTQRPFYISLVLLFPTLVARSTGAAKFRLKLVLAQLKQNTLPFINFMGEIKKFLPVADKDPNLFCTVWEDNRSTIKVAERPKFTLFTKHIALKYHHFRQFFSNGTLKINPIDTL